MIVISNDVDKVQEVCAKRGIKSWIIGEVTEGIKVEIPGL